MKGYITYSVVLLLLIGYAINNKFICAQCNLILYAQIAKCRNLCAKSCNRRPFSRFRFSVFFNSISGSQSPIEYKAENCNEREIRKLIINQNGVEFLPPRRRVFMDHSAYFKSNLRNSPSQCSRSQRARAPHTEKVDRTLRSRSSLGRRIKN